MARRALKPVEKFLSVEASSGMVLMAVSLLALAWANSPWRGGYESLWHTQIGLRLGPLLLEKDLHFLINDGLMTVFFFVVGLEIRREIHGGELSELRRAALPLVAALGGMLLPAILFVVLNHGHASIRGWGIPMATDIAFAVGVLALLGKRVPPALRILLLALAVIDDVGAIIVIAAFYSSGLTLTGLWVVGAGVVGILGMQAFGVRRAWLYVFPAVAIWAGALVTGIHPTLAGVVVGLMTPVRAWLGPRRFRQRAGATVAAAREAEGDDERTLLPHLERLNRERQEAVSPVERLQSALHRWVAFGVMPLFALANAGVSLGGLSFSGDVPSVLIGVMSGLVIGKPLGILGLSWLAVRAGVASLPRGISWSRVGVVGVVGGVGFTMSLFVAQLAFPSGALLEAAKLGILLASAVAALGAFVVGRVVLRGARAPDGASTLHEAESSTAL